MSIVTSRESDPTTEPVAKIHQSPLDILMANGVARKTLEVFRSCEAFRQVQDRPVQTSDSEVQPHKNGGLATGSDGFLGVLVPPNRFLSLSLSTTRHQIA
jgi:hypothetical protein